MRRARIATTHDDAAVAARVAAAVSPDNTDEMATDVDDERVVTTVERATTGGLRSTVDDYVVNYTVATRLSEGSTTLADGTDATTDRADAAAAADAHDDTNTDTNT